MTKDFICESCIHFDRCKGLYRSERLQKIASKGCPYFKDRSRFVELPCKVGDTLFVPTRNLVSEYKIVSFHVCGEGIWYRTNVIKGILTRLISDNVEIIGETVFLTREEAERALKLKERET